MSEDFSHTTHEFLNAANTYGLALLEHLQKSKWKVHEKVRAHLREDQGELRIVVQLRRDERGIGCDLAFHPEDEAAGALPIPLYSGNQTIPGVGKPAEYKAIVEARYSGSVYIKRS